MQLKINNIQIESDKLNENISEELVDFAAQRRPKLGERREISLSDVLSYTNDKIPQRFQKRVNINREKSNEIFYELLKYLWLCHCSPRSVAPTLIIDEMWHNFILFTHDYANFCREYFGYYVHHNPTPKGYFGYSDEFRRGEFEWSAEMTQEYNHRIASREFQEQIRIISERLGEETAVRWYIDYNREFDEEFFATAYRPLRPMRLKSNRAAESARRLVERN